VCVSHIYFKTANTWLHPSFGKWLFVGCDLIAGYLILLILQTRTLHTRALTDTQTRAMLSLWLFNPLVINISTRGSADVLVTLMVFATVLCVGRQYYGWGGLLFGLAVHFKLYPVIYSLSFVWFLFHNTPGDGYVRSIARFVVGAAVSFAALLFIFYRRYG
jgi:phosphatidylinositol glycan class M